MDGSALGALDGLEVGIVLGIAEGAVVQTRPDPSHIPMPPSLSTHVSVEGEGSSLLGFLMHVRDGSGSDESPLRYATQALFALQLPLRTETDPGGPEEPWASDASS